jgi:hypothetical protein
MNTLYNYAPSTVLILSLLTGCGGSSGGGSDDQQTTDKDTNNPEVCQQSDLRNKVNWEALLSADCQNLSDYNLFADPSDPTSNPSEAGIEYGLSTGLFTDYATKYRYVFVPDGKQAIFSEHEIIEFPVGTVIVKTFALPKDTSEPGVNETLIETRLLIHRESGWKARPYYWETTSDAKYIVSGKSNCKQSNT